MPAALSRRSTGLCKRRSTTSSSMPVPAMLRLCSISSLIRTTLRVVDDGAGFDLAVLEPSNGRHVG